jgi:hypothetical protein
MGLSIFSPLEGQAGCVHVYWKKKHKTKIPNNMGENRRPKRVRRLVLVYFVTAGVFALSPAWGRVGEE